MKQILYTLTALVFLSACKSVQKYVDKGDYDGAIEFATKKLHGQKKKKTKHVQGLEMAFGKVMDRDMRRIEQLDAERHPKRWDRVYSILKRVERRQERIHPFLPLISEDGYVAHFKFLRLRPLLREASDAAAAYHYDRAENLLVRARQGSKPSAREALDALQAVKKYDQDYESIEELLDEARFLGMTRILIESKRSASVIVPKTFDDAVLSLNTHRMNSRWKTFYTSNERNLPMDYRAVLDIELIDVSPEREKETHYIDRREIQDGFTYVLDSNGNVAKDSLGNDIKEPRFITVTAEVIELYRSKAATVGGVLRVFDLRNGELYHSKPVSVESVFEDYASRYSGDDRALCDRTRGRLRLAPEPFPSDFELTLDAADDLKSILGNELRRYTF